MRSRRKKRKWRCVASITRRETKLRSDESPCRRSMTANSDAPSRKNSMALTFGVSFAPNHPKEVAEWCRAAEDCGFERVGLVDSQSIYRELYVTCTAGLQATRRIQIGPRVTNPLTPHPRLTPTRLGTMAEVSDDRVFGGIGTGDSALINIGMKPVKLAALGEFLTTIRALMHGEAVQRNGSEMRLTWGKADVPIYVSAHGPKTLEFAGRNA